MCSELGTYVAAIFVDVLVEVEAREGAHADGDGDQGVGFRGDRVQLEEFSDLV